LRHKRDNIFAKLILFSKTKTQPIEKNAYICILRIVNQLNIKLYESNPENLLDFVQILSEELVTAGVLPEDYDFDAHKQLVPMQPGDVPVTYADMKALEEDVGFKPSTTLREGLRKFAQWYKEFYLQ
jgi:nucleoside-diphosphate-sugar epimerase